MTEADAKIKWCVKGDAPSKAEHCIGSDCMAWRWHEAKRTVAFLEAVQAHMQQQPKPNFNTAVQAVYAARGGQFERSEGYCGLAGSVQ